jgi:hypothetical protein
MVISPLTLPLKINISDALNKDYVSKETADKSNAEVTAVVSKVKKL